MQVLRLQVPHKHHFCESHLYLSCVLCACGISMLPQVTEELWSVWNLNNKPNNPLRIWQKMATDIHIPSEISWGRSCASVMAFPVLIVFPLPVLPAMTVHSINILNLWLILLTPFLPFFIFTFSFFLSCSFPFSVSCSLSFSSHSLLFFLRLQIKQARKQSRIICSQN